MGFTAITAGGTASSKLSGYGHAFSPRSASLGTVATFRDMDLTSHLAKQCLHIGGPRRRLSAARTQDGSRNRQTAERESMAAVGLGEGGQALEGWRQRRR